MTRVPLLLAGLLAALAPAAGAAPLLLAGGKVVTNSGPIQERADVLIDNGRVLAVGPDLQAPAGAARIDVSGKWVTPGLFAAFSRVGLAEIGAEDGSSDIGSGEDAPGAALDAAVAFNPAAAAVAVSRAGGITHAAIAPQSSAGLFSGRGAIVALDGDYSIGAARAFMLVDAGERGAELAGGSRAALWPELEAALDDALGYPQRYLSGQGGAVLSELDAKALAPFAKGEGLLLIYADRAADLRQVLALKRRRPALKLAVIGAAEGWRVARELAAANVAVIIDPMRALPGSFERLGVRLDNAALLEAAGVAVSIGPMPGSDDAFQNRLVTQYAGNAVANGLSWDAAFAAISRRPAQLFGRPELGALTPGARADLVVWDGDPLEVTSQAEQVFVEGAEASLETRQQALLARYRAIVLSKP